MSIINDFYFTKCILLGNNCNILLYGKFKNQDKQFCANVICSENYSYNRELNENFFICEYRGKRYCIEITTTNLVQYIDDINFENEYNAYLPNIVYCILCGMISTKLN